MLPTSIPTEALGRAVAEHEGVITYRCRKGDYKGHPSCQVSVRKIITTVFYYRD